MYRLFQELPQIDKGKVILPEFIFVRGFYLRHLAIIREYYREHMRTARNEHPLVKLLLGMNVSFNRDIRNYIDTASDQLMRNSSQLRMTSSLNHGFTFSPCPFYGNGIRSILVVTDEEFDIQAAMRDWENIEPLRVLRHPFTDISMGLADGDYEQSSETGLAVIEINVAKLALQYRMWSEQAKRGLTVTRNTAQFVAMYPIVNMLNSHLDIAVFNRMVAIYKNQNVAAFRRAHPFFIPDYTSKIDAVLKRQIQLQVGLKKEFDHTMMAIPLITSDTLYEAMILPEVVPTRQIKWALIVARLPIIKFLVRLNSDTDNHRNTTYLGRIRMALREMRSDRVLYQGMPADVIKEIETSINEEIAAYV